MRGVDMEKTISLQKGWKVLQDVHDIGEKTGLYREYENCTATGSQISASFLTFPYKNSPPANKQSVSTDKIIHIIRVNFNSFINCRVTESIAILSILIPLVRLKRDVYTPSYTHTNQYLKV